MKVVILKLERLDVKQELQMLLEEEGVRLENGNFPTLRELS